ncbi:DUF86 domain-containing protein [candidate division FCPU426 bacterium]|nr:DUF86 domain-containing protein [candidate division FCPU426 bacterium]
MFKNDLVRLKHMLESAREAVGFVKNRSRADLEKDRLLALGLLKSIEILGEAAARVSGETCEQYPHIPWTEIIAMRNRLVHVYFDIDLDQVWQTAMTDLPEIITQLEKITLT